MYNSQELIINKLFNNGVSLGLGDLTNKRDVWNLMVDTADPSNFQIRSRDKFNSNFIKRI